MNNQIKHSCSSCIDKRVSTAKSNVSRDYYKQLKESTYISQAEYPSVRLAAEEIEEDLLRTLPDNEQFQHPSSKQINKLRNVLQCYTLHNPKVGYCQVGIPIHIYIPIQFKIL